MSGYPNPGHYQQPNYPPAPGAGGNAPPPPQMYGAPGNFAPPPPGAGGQGPPPPGAGVGPGPSPVGGQTMPGVPTYATFAPPPPGSSAGPGAGGPPPPMGAGFQPPPVNPVQPGPGGPPPPGGVGGMQNLNSQMGGMNLNNAAPPPQPAVFQPQPSSQPPPPGGQSQFYSSAPSPKDNIMDRAGLAPPGQGMAPGMAPTQTQFEETADLSVQVPADMMRLTTSKIPATSTMLASTKVPIGGIIRPYATPMAEEDAVATIQPGAAGIVRCKRCRTYINPFVSWIENGRRWRCNICAQMNDCPSAYFCHLDEKNQRRDALQRPELSQGVVEWIAPSEYMVRAPQPPTYFFVIDVSVNAVRTGMLAAAADSIKAALDELPGGDRTKVGFITFDTAVHYYSLRPGSSNPQMLVVGDLRELFVPAPDDLLANLKESRAAIDNLLENLPTMFQSNDATESCLGPALKAAFTIMKAIGGKMTVFQSSLPTLGDGSLKPRENVRLMGTPDEVKLLRPETSWYKETALEFSKAQISVDMFLFPNQYIDCAALSQLPKITAGTMHTYVAFNATRDGAKFQSQLYRRLVEPTAFEAVLRIRCTKGMRINNFYGNFFIRGTDLMALPNCNHDSVFAFDLTHDEQSVNASTITIQSALLYTTSDGERRIRVSTQAVPTTTRISDFMSSVDSEAVCTLLSKQALDVSVKTNLDNARNRLQQSCVDMIRASKEGDKRTVSGYTMPSQNNPAVGDGAGEKDIPKNLDLLPLFTLSMLKNVAFRGGTDVHPDERIAAHMALGNLYVKETVNFIHPRFYPIHDMDSSVGLPFEDNSSEEKEDETIGRDNILLPKAISLSVDQLSSEGVYLLDNASETFIWVGRAANPVLINELFGVENLGNVNISEIKILTDSNDTAIRTNAIIQALREEADSIPAIDTKVVIVREGDAAVESRFFWNLVEDRAQFNGGTYNYTEFMQFINTPQAAPAGANGMGPGRMLPPGSSQQYQGRPMPPSGTGGHPPPPGPPGSAPPMMGQGRGPPPPSQMQQPAPHGPPGNTGAPPPSFSSPPPGPPSHNPGPPPPGPKYGTGPPSGPPSTSGSFQHVQHPNPPSQGSGLPPPPGSAYGSGPPSGPPSSGSFQHVQHPQPPSQGPAYGSGPPSGPPSSGGFQHSQGAGPPPPGSGYSSGPPSGQRQNYGPPTGQSFGGPPPPPR